MNLNHLYYFFIVARARSVTSAARELNIAQPSLSSQIKVFENALGKKMFERSGRAMKLSPDGELVYDHCRKIFAAVETMQKEVFSERFVQSYLNFGVSSETERPFLVEVASRFMKKYESTPHMRIRMSSDSNQRLFRQLKAGILDAVISTEPTMESEFSMLESASLPVVLVYNGEGRFKKISVTGFSSFRYLGRENQVLWALPQRPMRLRQEIDHFFEKVRLKPEISFESDVMATIVRAVIDDVGIAMLPKPYIRTVSKYHSIRWTGPKEGFWNHGLWLYCRKRDIHTKSIAAITSAFKSSLHSEALSPGSDYPWR